MTINPEITPKDSYSQFPELLHVERVTPILEENINGYQFDNFREDETRLICDVTLPNGEKTQEWLPKTALTDIKIAEFKKRTVSFYETFGIGTPFIPVETINGYQFEYQKNDAYLIWNMTFPNGKKAQIRIPRTFRFAYNCDITNLKEEIASLCKVHDNNILQLHTLILLSNGNTIGKDRAGNLIDYQCEKKLLIKRLEYLIAQIDVLIAQGDISLEERPKDFREPLTPCILEKLVAIFPDKDSWRKKILDDIKRYNLLFPHAHITRRLRHLLILNKRFPPEQSHEKKIHRYSHLRSSKIIPLTVQWQRIQHIPIVTSAWVRRFFYGEVADLLKVDRFKKSIYLLLNPKEQPENFGKPLSLGALHTLVHRCYDNRQETLQELLRSQRYYRLYNTQKEKVQKVAKIIQPLPPEELLIISMEAL